MATFRVDDELLDAMRDYYAREGVQVKLLAEDGELYVFAQSLDRVSKERAMRRRQLRWLWKRLQQIAAMAIPREELLMKLGAARSKAPSAWRLVDVETDEAGWAHDVSAPASGRRDRHAGAAPPAR